MHDYLTSTEVGQGNGGENPLFRTHCDGRNIWLDLHFPCYGVHSTDISLLVSTEDLSTLADALQTAVRKVRQMQGNGYYFEQALKRPTDYADLDPACQWDIDKGLGILDWDGECAHSNPMCTDCRRRWDERFGKK